MGTRFSSEVAREQEIACGGERYREFTVPALPPPVAVMLASHHLQKLYAGRPNRRGSCVRVGTLQGPHPAAVRKPETQAEEYMRGDAQGGFKPLWCLPRCGGKID
jgi:hypothetical protein